VRDFQKIPIFMDKVRVFGHTWGHFDLPIIQLKNSQPKVDFIIGSDVFYDNSEVFEDILATVCYFMYDNTATKFITAYHKRSSHGSLDFLLLKWGLVVEAEVTTDKFFPFAKYHGQDEGTSWSSIVILHIGVKNVNPTM